MTYTIRPNLNRKGESSLHDSRLGTVTRYETHGLFKATDFVVQPAGAARLVETGKRNVHAGFIGTVISTDEPNVSELTRILYHPEKLGFFAGERKITKGLIAFKGLRYYLVE